MKSDNVKIRSYQDSDKEKCRDLWHELTEHHRNIYDDPTIGGKDPGHFFDEHLARVGPNRIWLAEMEREIVGMIGLIEEDKEAEIEPIIVKREQRHTGIGKMLLEHVIEEAKRKKFKYLSIKPVMRNIGAIKTFYKNGFQNIGYIELFMDLQDKEGRKWLSDLPIFGLNFNY